MLPGRIAKAARPQWAGSPEARAADRIATAQRPTVEELNAASVAAPSGRKRKPITRRSPRPAPTPPTPKVRKPAQGPAGLIAAIKAAGATEFCAACYGYVFPGHTACPDWASLGLKVFRAATVVLTLEGGLTPEPESK